MAFFTQNELRINRYQIRIERLSKAFEGLRLVQISDLHFYERSSRAYYDRVAESVNVLKPDILAMTGDVVHFGPDHVARAQAFLKRLQARDAKLAVLGNHDYYDGAHGRHITAMLADSGFDLLVNENRVFEKQGARLWIAGLDDLWYGHPDIQKALAGIPTETETTLMLAHNPLLFDPVAMAGLGKVDLIMAGHTHAGHVYIPVLGPIYQKIFRMKYRYGLFEKNGCRLHVTSGVGSAAFYLKKLRFGFPRFRFNTHPEIAVLELTAG
jgi:predicted MPP superfamily phosphohydrolase